MVYVLNAFGQPLMPTKNHRKVRLLLKSGKAVVRKYSPFTIQLTIKVKQYVQPVTLGVDAGSKHVGVSAVSKNTDLFSAEMRPRNDVVNLLSVRREFRRSRRSRTKRCRPPRFNNRVHAKHKGWLAPSVEVKINNHIQIIKKVCEILPVSKIIVETAEFDLQRLKAMEEGKPLPVGEDYQKGEMYDQYNVRQYVLFRDGYRCRCCGIKPSEKNHIKLHVHHIESRKTGGDSPSNLIALCEQCHSKYHAWEISLPKNIKRTKSTRDAVFMGIMRKTLVLRLRMMFSIQVFETYGYITKYRREKYGIQKSHVSDARCIAGEPMAKPSKDIFLVVPIRRHNRQIHKASVLKGGIRKLNQAPKHMFEFKLFDYVKTGDGEFGFIFGRRSSGYFDIRHLGGKKISAAISYKKLSLLSRFNGLLFERKLQTI